MRSVARYLFALFLVTFAAAPAAFAGDVYAALHGTVTDPAGMVISGATVTVTNTATGITSARATDREGYYIFPQLQAGIYAVTISAPGFENFTASALRLNVNDNREVNARLVLGDVSQTVQVVAGALQVETANTQLQQLVTAEQLESVPLEGRDPAGLQKLEPGVYESSDRFGTFATNGSQTAQNSYLVDGIDINDPMLEREGIQVNPDALAEENIVTSTMNAEFARNSGAVVNQILKSGGSQFHGGGFEFYRDTFLNDGDYFSQTRPVFHQNLYGATLGGPVLAGRLFFFSAYQGLRNRTAQTMLQTTLDNDQFAGNFTGDLNYASGAANSAGLSSNPIPFNIGSCVANPSGTNPETWAQCFASGRVQVAPAQWNPIVAGLIHKYVLPSSETLGGVAYANFNALDTDAQDQGIVRMDWTPTAADSLWASSIFQSSPSTTALTFSGASFPGFGSLEADHYKLFAASWTHTFSTSLLNELRGSYFRNPYGAYMPTDAVSPSSAGFAITPEDSLHSGLPYLTIGSYFNLGFSYQGPQPRLDTNLIFADNVTWVRSNHSLKFGAQFEQFRVRNPYDVYNNGFFAFEGGAQGGGPYSSGDPLLDFALGIPDLYYQSNDGFIDAVANEQFAYAQDSWKLNPDLTLNYGMAWDVEAPDQNRQDAGLGVICWQNSSVTSNVFAGGPPGLMWPGDPGCNAAGSPVAHYDHFGPRLGFAWSPSAGPARFIGSPGAHDFSIRAGFGLYYNRDQEEQSLQNLEDPPFMVVSPGVTAIGGSPSLANPWEDVTGNGSMTNPFPYAPIRPNSTIEWTNYLPLQLAAFAPNYSVPYTYNYNLNVQRALNPRMVAQVGYVGSTSRRLASWYEGDAITAAGHAACLASPMCASNLGKVHLLFPQYAAQPALVAGNPYGLPNGTPYYVSVGEQNTEGTSNYNALQASLIQAPAHGLAFTLAYTYSHALDDASGYESAVGRTGRVRNYVPGFENLNYGSSDFDARQRLVASYVYNLPSPGFLAGDAAMRAAFSGWSVGGLTVLQSGFPVPVYEPSERSGWCDGYSYFGCGDVPEISSIAVGRLNVRAPGNRYFDALPFSTEPEGTFGNTPRNFFHGPGFDYTNLQLSKDLYFNSDRSRYAELRIESFNVFNHANFANPSGNYLSGSFGRVTSVVQSADPNGDPSPGRAVQLAGKFYF
jgi:Carboxypeptidase regulatory-like domain